MSLLVTKTLIILLLSTKLIGYVKANFADSNDKDKTTILNNLLDRNMATEALQIISELSDAEIYKESVKLAHGRALIQINHLKDGENIIKELIAANPSSIEATLMLAKLYVSEKKWDVADNLIQKLLENDNENPKTLALYSRLILARGNNIKVSRSLIERAARHSLSDA